MAIPSFLSYLHEEKTGILMHLQHLEDLILDEGIAGLRFVEDVLREFHRMLKHGGVSTSLNITTKWDGAPSVIFGPDPADGVFFVATKAAFSKTPKLMKTHQQIQDQYGDTGVSDKLHTCLSELSQLKPKQILQGDLLYTGSVPTEVIDGTSCLVFRPNTIAYAVDANSELGHRIARSTLGIVIHTMYAGHGKSIADYHSTPITPGVFASLTRSARVVTIDHTFDDVSGTVTFTTREESDFALAYAKISEGAGHIPVSLFTEITQEPVHGLIQMFINDRVRQGNLPKGIDAVNGLSEFISTRRDMELAKLKTDAAKQKKAESFNHMLNNIHAHHAHYAAWFNLHMSIANAKNIITQKLSQTSKIGTFIPTDTGYRLTGHEGFVAVSHSGKMVKLVDRLEFSRNNFLVPKQWAKP